MRDIRTLNNVEGQKIESDLVMKRIGDLAYRNLGTLSRSGFFDSGKALIVGDGLRVEPSTGMTVNLPTGVFFQRFVDVIPCMQISAQTITMDAASGSPRVDIIEAQVKSIADKSDVTQTATVASGSAISITNETIKRDIKYYLSARKQTNTTTPTAATAGILTGTVSISGTIDLSEDYLINLADGEDGSYQEIDCRGATPEATTRAEIIANINAAVGRTMASTGASDVIVLTGDGTGVASYFEIKPPATDADKDAANVIFGISIGGVYRYTYSGTNEWVKIAEIDIGAATTTITSGLIRNIDEKETWASESENVIVAFPVYSKLSDRTDVTSLTSSHRFPVEDENGYQGSVEEEVFDNKYNPVGTIRSAATSTPETEELLCDGSAISRTTYAKLFARVGTTWGVGDGSTTFNIPDLRGIFLRGAGTHGTLLDSSGAAFTATLAAYVNDAMQKITGTARGNAIFGTSRALTGVYKTVSVSANRAALDPANSLQALDFDSSGSTSPNPARTSDTETYPVHGVVNFFIKVI